MLLSLFCFLRDKWPPLGVNSGGRPSFLLQFSLFSYYIIPLRPYQNNVIGLSYVVLKFNYISYESCVLVTLNLTLKVWSHLTIFNHFSLGKSSHFHRNPHDREFVWGLIMRMTNRKQFGLKVSCASHITTLTVTCKFSPAFPPLPALAGLFCPL